MTLVGALLLILLVLVVAMIASYAIAQFVPSDDPRYKNAARVVLGLIVFVCIVAILWPFIGHFWNANVNSRGPPGKVEVVR